MHAVNNISQLPTILFQALMSRANLSYSSLANWIFDTPFQGLFNGEIGFQDLGKICAHLDASQVLLSPKDGIGLEIHHLAANQVDISIFGDCRLLDVPAIQYPLFAKEWSDMIKNNLLQNALDEQIIVEFDSSEYGYRMMGLFQRIDGRIFGHNELFEVIKLYLASRQKELGRFLPSEFISVSVDQLNATCDALGLPVFVGFLDRDLMAVKLVIPVHASNLEAAFRFLRHYSAKSCLHCNFEIQPVIDFLKNSVVNNCRPRISIDYDLEKACFMDRLSFEFTPSSVGSNVGCLNELSCLEETAQPIFSDCVIKSQLLRSRLPYGQKKLSFNLVNQIIFTMVYAHSKLTFHGSTMTLKDYVMVQVAEQ